MLTKIDISSTNKGGEEAVLKGKHNIQNHQSVSCLQGMQQLNFYHQWWYINRNQFITNGLGVDL